MKPSQLEITPIPAGDRRLIRRIPLTTHHKNPRRNKAHTFRHVERSPASGQPTGITDCGKKVYQPLYLSLTSDPYCKHCFREYNV